MYYFLVSDFFVFVSWILHQVNYSYHISRLNRQKSNGINEKLLVLRYFSLIPLRFDPKTFGFIG